MWDYDKFFAEGNIIGISPTKNEVINLVCSKFNHNIDGFRNLYSNNDLSYKNIKIQYIIRLDEHGNVVKKLFDRDRDMESKSKPMPELETGMFIRVYDKSEDKTILAFVYKEGKRVIYQDGDFDDIADVIKGDYTKIVEVYPESVLSFNCCYRGAEIWRSPESN